MTTRYAGELKRLHQAYATACRVDIAPLAEIVEGMAGRPVLTVGSGGSYSMASFAAFLHELYTRAVARPVTPLELISTPVREVGVLCFSASGRNRDICIGFKTAALREARPLAALVMAGKSPLHDLGRTFAYSDIASYPSANFRDGFLAVASLIGAAVLMVRAYRRVADIDEQMPEGLDAFMEATAGIADCSKIIEIVAPAVSMTSVSMLHTAALKPVAIDLESRFVEAALGRLHTADLRNFGHGRHYWFAKRASETGIVAFIGDNTRKLADRTFALLPDSSPIARFDFEGRRDAQALAGLVIGLYVAEAAGRVVGVDPARPGVPEFGRKLYRLGPGPSRRHIQDDHFEVAVHRKARRADLGLRPIRDKWLNSYESALSLVVSAEIAGVVFDYDGTLCDSRHRFDPLSNEIATALAELAIAGASIGVATGRGDSAGKALRAAIPKSVWDRFIIGYYNGGFVAPLADVDAPLVAKTSKNAASLHAELCRDPVFEGRELRTNAKQITVFLRKGDDPLYVVDAAKGLLEHGGVKARVTLSSHSIDIVLEDASKLKVVEALKKAIGVGPSTVILRIGDKGRAPGNDAELLNDPLGLSVDEASPSPDVCWAFSPPGVLGVQATLYYLDRLDWSGDRGCLDIRPRRYRRKS